MYMSLGFKKLIVFEKSVSFIGNVLDIDGTQIGISSKIIRD